MCDVGDVVSPSLSAVFVIRRIADRAPLGIRENKDTAGDLGGLAREYIPRSGDCMDDTMDRFGDA